MSDTGAAGGRTVDQRQQLLVEATVEVTRALLSEPGEGSLQLIVDTAADLVEADATALAMRMPPDGTLVVRTATGKARPAIGRTLPSGEGTLGGAAISSARAVRGRGPFPRVADMLPQLNAETAAVAPLAADGRVLGLLYAGRGAGRAAFTDADEDLLTSLANAAAIGLQLADAREHRLELERSVEREQVAADLHDHVVQQLFAVGIDLEAIADSVPDPALRGRLNRHVDVLDATIARIRGTIRQLHGLAPLETDEQFAAQLEAVLDDAAAALGFRPGLQVADAVHALGADDEFGELRDDLLAVTREALTNVARHARATRTDVTLTTSGGRVVLTVTDDGVGVQPSPRRSGLRYAQSRAERHRGSFTVEPGPDGGTVFIWTGHTG